MPNGSRDIPLQSQEFEQDRCRHFVDFLPHFHLNMTSQSDAILQNIEKMQEKMRVQYLRSLLFDLLTFCRFLELNKGILPDFKFHCYGN